MKKIFYIMNIDWNWIKQRPHFIAEQLAKSNDVVIFYPYRYGRKSLQSRKKRNLNLKAIYLIPRISGIEKLTWINDGIFSLIIRMWILLKSPDIVYLTYPSQTTMIPSRFKGKIVYDCMDNHIAFSKNEKKKDQLLKLEKRLVNDSNTIFVSSNHLLNTIIERYNVNESKCVLVRNAYNGKTIQNVIYKYYDKRNRFNISYIGTISEWFDWDIINEVLRKENNVEFHLYGPIQTTVIPNDDRIVYHGTIEHDQLYECIQEADCLVMPFIVNEIVKAVDPVKVYEYINFNKNILLRFYDEVKRFDEYVYFYNTCEEFISQIHKMMETNEPKYNEVQRERFLIQNSWENRIEIMGKYL